MLAEIDIEDRRTAMFVGEQRRTVLLAERTPSSRTCRTCGSPLATKAHYCGMCGQRVRARREPLTGTILDELYELEDKLAEGGFATVYRARYLPTGFAVAIKVLHQELAADPRIAARFRREGRSLLRLRHRHTVATYDYGETLTGTQYIVMELLHGESLQERLRMGPLPWREVLRIMRAVCKSLGEAHGHGLVHRDLKPANIYLCNDDVVKVIDFGLAKVLDGEDEDLTRAGQTVGTLQYMPPEQLLGAPCDCRTDMFALGVVAYEALTGLRPFPEATTAESLMTALLTQQPPLPSSLRSKRDVPDEVDQLLLRCLEREPNARFATGDELAAEIDRILAIPEATRRNSWVLPHTPAFELQPPRIVIEPEPEPLPVPARPLGSWVVWAMCFIAGGVGVGTAIARLV